MDATCKKNIVILRPILYESQIIFPSNAISEGREPWQQLRRQPVTNPAVFGIRFLQFYTVVDSEVNSPITYVTLQLKFWIFFLKLSYIFDNKRKHARVSFFKHLIMKFKKKIKKRKEYFFRVFLHCWQWIKQWRQRKNTPATF